MSKLIIYAPNVHTGGGKTLLLNLLESIPDNTQLILDCRLVFPDSSPKNIIFKSSPTFRSRLKAEFELKKNSNKNDTVLCFHSLPPLFKSRSRVFVYFHNKHLLSKSKVDLPKENMRAIFRIFLEKILAKTFYSNVDEYFVQSIQMKRDLEFFYSKKMSKVTVFPFLDVSKISKSKKNKIFSFNEFIYVSEGPKHKNHKNLIKAWVYLSKQNIFPKLTLTLSNNNVDELDYIYRAVEKYQIKVENIGYIEFDKVLDLYGGAKALIFPSFMESFGLPLIEAKLLDLPIIAPELDYVRDVCDPEETFDPNSEISIARAVKRFLKIQDNKNVENNYEVRSFVKYINK